MMVRFSRSSGGGGGVFRGLRSTFSGKARSSTQQHSAGDENRSKTSGAEEGRGRGTSYKQSEAEACVILTSNSDDISGFAVHSSSGMPGNISNGKADPKDPCFYKKESLLCSLMTRGSENYISKNDAKRLARCESINANKPPLQNRIGSLDNPSDEEIDAALNSARSRLSKLVGMESNLFEKTKRRKADADAIDDCLNMKESLRMCVKFNGTKYCGCRLLAIRLIFCERKSARMC